MNDNNNDNHNDKNINNDGDNDDDNDNDNNRTPTLTVFPTIASVKTKLVDTGAAALSSTMKEEFFIGAIFLFHLILFHHVRAVEPRVLHSFYLADVN